MAILCRLARERASPFAVPSPARYASTRYSLNSVLHCDADP